MSFSKKMVMKEIKSLKKKLYNLYIDSLVLYNQILKKIQTVNNKKSWEYTTYIYLKSTLYERKNKYKKLYKTTCEVEDYINAKIRNL